MHEFIIQMKPETCLFLFLILRLVGPKKTQKEKGTEYWYDMASKHEGGTNVVLPVAVVLLFGLFAFIFSPTADLPFFHVSLRSLLLDWLPILAVAVVPLVSVLVSLSVVAASSLETPRAISDAFDHASRARGSKRDPIVRNTAGAFANHGSRQQGAHLPGPAGRRHMSAAHNGLGNDERGTVQALVSTDHGSSGGSQKATTKGGRLSQAKQAVVAAKRGSLAATNMAAGVLSPSKRASGVDGEPRKRAEVQGRTKGHGARVTGIVHDGVQRKRAGRPTPTISTEAAGGRAPGELFKTGGCTGGHKTISFENDSRSGLSLTPRVGARCQGTYVSSYLEPEDLNARPVWDSSPMRGRPSVLRGLRPVTREPWAADEEVYKQRRGALAMMTGRYLGTPERYLDKTARDREAEGRESHYRSRLDDKYASSKHEGVFEA